MARALAQEPKILLLDEPGAFLDVRHPLELLADLYCGQNDLTGARFFLPMRRA